MNPMESEIVLALMISGVNPEIDEDAPPITQIMYKRIPESVRSQYDTGLIFLCSVLADGNPGNAVMWAYTLVKNQIKTVEQFAHSFPWGVPTRKAYDEVWDAQKSSSGNLMDLPGTWNEITAEDYDASNPASFEDVDTDLKRVMEQVLGDLGSEPEQEAPAEPAEASASSSS